MALPVDFWRNEQLLNIIRTRPCARFQRSGLCDWKSQCQYSHCLAWPRRPPSRHSYSAELCKHVTVKCSDSQAKVEVKCPKDKDCQYAHSKEEVLYHPHLFKTLLCQEYQNNSEKCEGKGSKLCHRYYCPFAHGTEELRKSPLKEEVRQALLSQVQKFPRDDCCEFCPPSRSPSGAIPDNTSPSPQQASPPRKSTGQNGKGRFSPNFHQSDASSIQGGQFMQYRNGWVQGGNVSGYSNGCGAAEGAGTMVQQQNGCRGGQVPPMMQGSPNQMGQGQVPQFVAMIPGCMPGAQGGMQIMQLAMPASSPQGASGCGDMCNGAGNGAVPVMQFSPALGPSQPQQGGQGTTQDSSHATGNEDVSSFLREANLDYLADTLKRHGIESAEDFANLTEESMEHFCLSPHDQLRLQKAVDGYRAKAASKKQGVQMQANCWMPPGEGMRPGMAMQPMMMNGYGQWMSPAACPEGYMMWPQANMGQMYCPPTSQQVPQLPQGANGQYIQAPFPMQQPQQQMQQPMQQRQMQFSPQMMTDHTSAREAMNQTPPPSQANSNAFTPPPLPLPESADQSGTQRLSNGRWDENSSGPTGTSQAQAKRRSHNKQIPEVIEVPYEPLEGSGMLNGFQNGLNGVSHSPGEWRRQGENLAITGM